MAWSDFLSAVALLLIMEGVLPFANPRGFKRRMEQASQLDERALRAVGLVIMLGGALLLYLVRQT